VLSVFVPLTGTADRRRVGAQVVGRYGIRTPADADDETKALYAKVVNIEWDDSRAEQGDTGTHTGTINRRFLRESIAPLIHRDGPR